MHHIKSDIKHAQHRLQTPALADQQMHEINKPSSISRAYQVYQEKHVNIITSHRLNTVTVNLGATGANLDRVLVAGEPPVPG